MGTTMENETAGREGGPCGVLLGEHRRFEDLVLRFKRTAGRRRRKAAGDECLAAVEGVLALEEQLFCPAVRGVLGSRLGTAQVLAEGRAARGRIAEARAMPAGEEYDARFLALADGVARHFAAERSGIIPLAEGSELDAERLGSAMAEFRERFARARAGGLGRRCLRAVSALLP